MIHQGVKKLKKIANPNHMIVHGNTHFLMA